MQKEYKVRVNYVNNEVYSIVWHNQQDQIHREDGPAMEFTDGCKSWWFNGKSVSEQECLRLAAIKTTDSCEDKIVEIDGKKYKLKLV